jgi:hypothetical protein
MKPVAYKVIWLSLFLVLLLAARTVQAQSEEKGDQPVMPGGQTGSMQGQGSMEGMRGGQGGMGQMTCV